MGAKMLLMGGHHVDGTIGMIMLIHGRALSLYRLIGLSREPTTQ
jgi:hypothetical protein